MKSRISFQTAKNENPQQLVLFNKDEQQILNRLKPSNQAVENIKKIKHLFHGELVTCDQ